MNTKLIATAILSGFVAIAIVAMVYQEVRPTAAAEQVAAAPAAPLDTAAEPTSAQADIAPAVAGELPAADQQAARYVAYYLHGNHRCFTCRKIQDQSHAALKDQIAEGIIEWTEINFDEPENRHYIQDFALPYQSLVLAELRGSETVRWVNLSDVWVKVQGSSAGFEHYVVEATASFLNGDNAS